MRRVLTYIQVALLALGFLFATPLYAITLPGAIQHAMQANPDVRFYNARRHATKEQLRQARAGYLPTVELDAGYGREKTRSPTAFSVSGTRMRTLWRREIGANLTQNIFDGYGTRNEVRRNKAKICSVAYKLRGTANDLALDVSERYINVLRYQRLLGLARHNLQVHQNIMAKVQERSTAGVSRQAEVQQARSRLSLARANLIAQQANLRDAKIAFIRIVNIAPTSLRRPAAPDNNLLPRSLQSAVSTALYRHPILRSASADIDATVYQHRAAKSFNYPRVDLVLNVRRDKDLDGIPGRNEETMGIVRGRYYLYRGGVDYARQRETAHLIQEAREVKNRTILQVEELTRYAWNGLTQVRRRLIPLRQHQASASDTTNAYREQFKVGQRTLLDLLDAENERYEATQNLINAEYDELFDRYRLLNATDKLLRYTGTRLTEEANLEEYCVKIKESYAQAMPKGYSKGMTKQASAAKTTVQPGVRVVREVGKSPEQQQRLSHRASQPKEKVNHIRVVKTVIDDAKAKKRNA